MNNTKLIFFISVILILNSCGFGGGSVGVTDIGDSIKSIAAVTAFTAISIP